MIHVTEQMARQALEQAVLQYGPDWVDPNSGEAAMCQNVYDYEGEDGLETRRCIAAQAFNNLGVPDGVINKLPGSVTEDIPALEHHGIGEFDYDAAELLRIAQERQDDGTPWGRCIPGESISTLP